MRTGLAVLLALLLAAAPAAEAKNKTTKKVSCPAGQLPVLTGKGKKAKVARDRRGRPKCAAPKRPVAKAIPQATAATSTGRLALAADEVEAALAVHPGAVAPLQRKIGT
ncbi:MAG TPA: hypothetical protein VM684_13630, partial [Gaiellales bacterium]|nr:hypothetical protein [Gaiellales bacterium]